MSTQACNSLFRIVAPFLRNTHKLTRPTKAEDHYQDNGSPLRLQLHHPPRTSPRRYFHPPLPPLDLCTKFTPDALHATRLLAGEERPFHRLTRLLLNKDSLLKWSTPPHQLPSPPPDNASETETTPPNDPSAEEKSKRAIFREELLLEFASLTSSLLRIQLQLTSNALERTRYASEKSRILSTAQAVRQNTSELRAQLAAAQRTLALRKGYDELAAKLIDPRKLRTRGELGEEIRGLGKEIEELEGEREDFGSVWEGRREVFERVVREGRVMVGVVRGVKEEVEEEKGGDGDEAMEGDGDGDEGKGGEGSRIGTPAPEGNGRTPVRREMTPLPDDEGGGTTGEDGDGVASAPTNGLLEVQDGHHETRGSSQAPSPLPDSAHETTDDVEMADDDEQAALAPQPKTTAGMEVTGDQVATPADGMEGTEDQQPEAAVGVEEFGEEREEMNAVAVAPVEAVGEDEDVATPADKAEEMDES